MALAYTPNTETGIFRVAIIGAGFGGLCAAIKLKQSGEENFIILERGATVGGTWRDNAYPGCACDVPAVLYSFSFEQNPDWSRKFPTQPELHEYLQRVATKYGITPHIRFQHTVFNSAYDESGHVWRLQTSHGEIVAQVLICAAGGLSVPAIPDIPGLHLFRGRTFHSAEWDHDFDLRGKRVAVIGTGASAIQIVPEIAPRVEQLDLYQRTPPWVVPRRDREVRAWVKALRRTPLKWVFRWGVYLLNEVGAIWFTRFPGVLRLFQRLARRHIRRQVSDEELCAKLIPDYTLGCKRVLISDDWYPALRRENVEVVSESIRQVNESGIVTSDGKQRDVDAIVLSTGFRATDNPIATKIAGRGGRTLAQTWTEGEEAYLGTVIHGFPNLFFITGPNTGIGHTSLVFIIESQVAYIVKCLQIMRRKSRSVMEVRAEVQAKYNERLQARMPKTVWASGCKSWYQSKNGKITTLWPGLTIEFWWKLRRVRKSDYMIEEPVDTLEPAAAQP